MLREGIELELQVGAKGMVIPQLLQYNRGTRRLAPTLHSVWRRWQAARIRDHLSAVCKPKKEGFQRQLSYKLCVPAVPGKFSTTGKGNHFLFTLLPFL